MARTRTWLVQVRLAHGELHSKILCRGQYPILLCNPYYSVLRMSILHAPMNPCVHVLVVRYIVAHKKGASIAPASSSSSPTTIRSMIRSGCGHRHGPPMATAYSVWGTGHEGMPITSVNLLLSCGQVGVCFLLRSYYILDIVCIANAKRRQAEYFGQPVHYYVRMYSQSQLCAKYRNAR